jgi:hypothetical protein
MKGFHEGIRLGIEFKKVTSAVANERQESIEHICGSVTDDNQTMLSVLTKNFLLRSRIYRCGYR